MAQSNTSNHYVDNVKFYEACLEHYHAAALAKSEGRPVPKLNDYIGSCILKIATKLSYSRNFINYPHREEMIGDGIENCILYFHNFNPIKYKSPFSYFTRIIYFAFLRRIHREKKQMYVRHKVMMNQIDEGLADVLENGGSDVDDFALTIDKNLTENDYITGFVNNFEESAKKRRDARRTKKGVEKFFEADETLLDEELPDELSIESEID